MKVNERTKRRVRKRGQVLLVGPDEQVSILFPHRNDDWDWWADGGVKLGTVEEAGFDWLVKRTQTAGGSVRIVDGVNMFSELL